MVELYFSNIGICEVLPIVTQKNFLSCKSGEFGWFKSKYFILPFIIERKFFFKRIVFTSSTICLKGHVPRKNEEREFLNCVIGKAKEMKVDFIYQPMTYAVFSDKPDGSIFCKALTYQIDLCKTEEEIFKNLNSKHRNVVKRAQKDGVQILCGSEYREECYKSIKDTMDRQNKPCISRQQVEKYHSELGDNVSFYIAEKDGVSQGAAIFIWNEGHTCYYFHGGSAVRPATGALNLLQWQAMCDMKKKGVKIFDFVGGRISPLKGSKQEGIQRFKSRFGAKPKTGYLWKYPVKPFKYWLFRVFAHLNALMHSRKYLGDIIDEEIRNAQK